MSFFQHTTISIPLSTVNQTSNALLSKTNINFNSSSKSRSNYYKKQYETLNNTELLNQKVNEYMAIKKMGEAAMIDDEHDQFCVCTDCIYQRNLARPSHTLFNLTMRSIYAKDYKIKSPEKDTKKIQKIDENQENLGKQGEQDSKIEAFQNNQEGQKDEKYQKNDQALINTIDTFNGKQINEKQSSIHPKTKITFETIYNKQMNRERSEPRTKLLKGKDNLKFDGPLVEITSYRERFPGIYGGNPYVKPVDNALRDSFKLDTKTMNSSFFKGQFTQRAKLMKSPDQLKLGLPSLIKQSSSHKVHNLYENPQRYNTLHINSIELNNKKLRPLSPKDKHQYCNFYYYIEIDRINVSELIPWKRYPIKCQTQKKSDEINNVQIRFVYSMKNISSPERINEGNLLFYKLSSI